MDETGYLTFALTKGRLAEKTLALLEQTGITCEEMKEKGSRKLIFVNEALKLKFFLAKGPDVPTYVEYGAADIGVTGGYMRCSIWALGAAACASAGNRRAGRFWSTTSASGWQANIR